MHFSIPETTEQKDAKGSTFTTFHVHINGVRHCVVRYRQLHALHEQLRRQVAPAHTLPFFPPKRLLPLGPGQVEERRAQLEKYLQLISQDARVNTSVVFNGFLLSAQQETRAEKTEEVTLDVYLMNEHKISVRGLTVLQTEEVLERVCKQLGVPDEYVYHFALFLLQRKEGGDFVVVRKIQEFESPYITQKCSVSSASSASSASQDGKLQLVLRKASWDPQFDEVLFTNKSTLNLLYIQTLAEVERGWVLAGAETKKQLARMQARGAKLEYMQTALRLPYYGYLRFQPCLCDYPTTNTSAQILIGRRELIVKIRDAQGQMKEGSFKVTKMRCWRIMTAPTSAPASDPQQLELSFEYLMNSGELQWVTVVSAQAILMSLSLQSIVEELLRVRGNVPIKKAGEESCCSDYHFQRKDGSIQKMPIRAGLHAAAGRCGDGGKSGGAVTRLDPKSLASLTGRQYSVKRLSERFDVVHFREAARLAENVLIENEAFLDIKEEEDDEDNGGGQHL